MNIKNHMVQSLRVGCYVALVSLVACGGGGGSSSGEPATITPISHERTSPPNLMELSSYDTAGQSRAVVVDGDIVYVADGAQGLEILRIEADNKLKKIATSPLSFFGRAYDLVKSGNLIYLAARSDGIKVLDVSVPSLPRVVASLPTPNEASFVEASDNMLFVSAKTNFLIYDISNPIELALLGILEGDMPFEQMVVDGDLVFVASYADGLSVIDISDPTTPALLSRTGVGYNAYALAKKGDHVYIGGGGRLDIFDVRDPSTPVLIGGVQLPDDKPAKGGNTESGPFSIEVWNDFVFVAGGDEGVLLVDVSSVGSLKVVGALDTEGSARAMTISGRNLLVAELTAGVKLVDIFETTDVDGDGVVDGADAFPNDATETEDADGDGIGNNTDTDDDNDGVADVDDALPLDPTETVDSDGDGIGNNADQFPNDASESVDSDGDGVGNNADDDDDNDGLVDTEDEAPKDPLNRIQITFDGNGHGYPKLDGDMVVWRGYRSSGAPTIFLQNLTTGERIDLGKGISGWHGIPSLSNGQVAWRVWLEVEDKFKFYLYDGQNTSVIAEAPAGDFTMPWGYKPSYHSVEIQIDNGELAWAGWDGEDYEIYFYSNGVTTQITDNNVDDFEAQLHNGQIAWTGEEYEGAIKDDWDIFFWDGATIQNVSNHPGVPDKDAHLMNGTIAWSGHHNSRKESDIYFWDGERTTIIPLSGADFEPQIDENEAFVTWNNVSADGNLSLHVWDGFKQFTLLDPPEPNDFIVKSVFADQGRIAWVGYDNGGADIYIGTYRVDKDGDGVVDGADAFPLDPLETLDTDKDGIGNIADLDDDGDGVPDASDLFPLSRLEFADTDADGVGNNSDILPLDNSEWEDRDIDGIGDNADADQAVVLTAVDIFATGGQAFGIAKKDDIIYVADGLEGVRILRLANDGSFSEIGFFKLDTSLGDDVSARSVELVGDNLLYVAYRSEGLYILDVTDPTNPTEVIRIDTEDRATFLEIEGDRLYLSDREALIIFDISVASSPQRLGAISTESEFERVVAEQGILYIAGFYTGLVILDASDPSDVVELSKTAVDGALWAVAKHGNILFVGGEGSGLYVFDVSDPNIQLELATMDLPSLAKPKPADQPPFKMEVVGDYLFIADGYSGIQVVDISDPLSPILETAYDTVGYTFDFEIDGYTLLVGSKDEGIHHINLGISLNHDGDSKPNYLDNFDLDAALQ